MRGASKPRAGRVRHAEKPDKYELAFQLPRYRDLGYPSAVELDEVLRIRGVDFSEEIGGKVTLVEHKVGASDWTFKDWDPLGHTLSWDFELEEEGYYALGIRYCAASPATRRLFINGKTPYLEAELILFPETGGWSNESDDWQNWVFSDSSGQPYLFYLPAGKNRLTMRNTSASGLNVEYLTILKAER